MTNNRIFRFCSGILFLITVLVTNQAIAQNISIKGTVVSATSGEPLMGATVVAVEAPQIGAITDMEGNFKLTISDKVKSLEVAYLGYIKSTVNVTTADNIVIKLSEDAKVLDDVVVVGYGDMRKSDVTGSISSITVDDNEAMNSSSIQTLLQGRATGVQITSSDGAPGAAISMKIRGTSSLTGDSEPLYVVDGIVMNSTTSDASISGSTSSDQDYSSASNGLTGINPADIASIDILKDASATAIYGSLGANGVVLITTKMGNSDKPKIQYSGSFSVSEMVNKRDMLNLEEFAIYRTDLDNIEYNLANKVAVDWQDEISRIAITNNHRLSVSGKSNKTTYYISGGYMDYEGVIKNTDLSQADMRVNLKQQISDKLMIGTNSSFTYLKSNMIQNATSQSGVSTGLIRQALSFYPYDPNGVEDEEIYDTDGTVMSSPMAWFDNYISSSREYRALVSANAQYKFNKNLNMRTTLGVDYRNKERQVFTEPPLYNGTVNGGVVSVPTMESTRINIDHTFNYTYQKGGHRLNAMAGGTVIMTNTVTNSVATTQLAGIYDYDVDSFLYGTSDDTSTYSVSKFNTLSGLARVIYSYDNRYVLTSTFRADGSSKFAKGNRWGFFPSFAFAYRIDQEQFMKGADNISNLKLRLGWGQVGNQSAAAYQTAATYASTTYTDNINGGFDLGVYRSNLYNEDLTWETTQTYNAGLDLGFFSDRLNLIVDAYYKSSTDLLQNISVAGLTGYSSMYINRGSISNRGLEFALDATLVDTKNFTLSVAGNISFNRNNIDDIGLDADTFGAHTFAAMAGNQVGSGTFLSDYANIFIEGQPVALFFGHKITGIIQAEQVTEDYAYRVQQVKKSSDSDRNYVTNPISDSELLSVQGILPIYNSTLPTAGDPLYADINGDGIADSNDETIIGDPNPDFTYGFSLSMQYKNWTLDAIFNGSYGGELLNGSAYGETYTKYGNYNISQDLFDNYYREDRPSTTHPRLNPNFSWQETNSMYIEDGSFLRLSNVSLGYRYQLPRKSVISSVHIGLMVRNVFCLTKYSGYDPEVGSFANDPLRVGIDWLSYPNSRTYSLSVTLDF